jgi:hypothetical protein
MRLPTRPVAAVVAACVLLVACGSSTVTPRLSSPTTAASRSPSVLPQPVSGELGVGENRVVFGLTDGTGQKPVGAPDRTLTIGYHGPNGESIPPAPQTFIWAIEGSVGVYVGHATFATAGSWTADFTTEAPGSAKQSMTFSFDVKPKTQVVRPGDAAPSVATPTLADVGGDVAKISSDPKPVPAFYQMSEAAALAAHKPFVLVFATPKFCTSQTCGPTLDRLKPVAAAHPEMTFINVEPYKLTYRNGSLQADLDASGALVPVEATTAFGLSTEPFVFVVRADGKVSASFELVFSADEIEAAIKAVEAG